MRPRQGAVHLDRALAPNAAFIDPSVETHGIDEFGVNVPGVRRRLPWAVYERTSGVDSHHSDISIGYR